MAQAPDSSASRPDPPAPAGASIASDSPGESTAGSPSGPATPVSPADAGPDSRPATPQATTDGGTAALPPPASAGAGRPAPAGASGPGEPPAGTVPSRTVPSRGAAGASGPGEPPAERPDEDADEDGGGGKMSFLDHLDELRRRLIASFSALAVGFMVCFGFIEPIFDFIMEPLAAVLEDDASLIYTSAPEFFFLNLKMAALAGLILATPVVMSQLWLFIAPGLYAHEKKFAIPFVGFASVFFIGGTYFGHYILFQVAWGFFANFGAETAYVTFMPRLQDAFSLYVRLVLACGVIFQLPTVVFFLARMGVTSPRFLIRNFKYAFLLCFVLAAILTPTPDPVTMTVMAGPMLALYVMSIGIAWVFRKRTAD